MRLSALDWDEAETGGLLKSAHSVAEASFVWDDRPFIAVEWFHRTGHPFRPYASLVLIAEECDKTADGALLRAIAFGAPTADVRGEPKLVHSATLDRRVIVINDPADRDMDLAPWLSRIAAEEGTDGPEGGAAEG